MKLLCSLLAILSVAVFAQPSVFPSQEDLMNPKKWTANSSGSMTISFDEAEQALRFDVTFPANVDKWIYPKFRVKSPVTFNGAKTMTFDMKIAPTPDFNGFVTCLLMLGGRAGYTPAEPGQWKTITLDLSHLDLNSADELQLGMNPKYLKHTYFVKNIRFGGTPMERVYQPAVTTDAPSTVFFENSEHVFKATRVLPNLRYTVEDWHGNVLLQGAWPADGKEPLVIPPQKPGYYMIKTTNDSDISLRDYSFTVIVDPAKRVFPKDSFFAMDAALSWVSRPGTFECPWYDGDTYRLTADLCKWAGLVHIRERLSWNQTQPKPDEPPKYGHYLDNAKMCKERGIYISGMFHDSANWADRLEKLPANLAALYTYCKYNAEVFGDCMLDWEFWNEQDIGFAPESAWDYAAAFKAAYLGFKAGKKDMPVTFGAICAGPLNPYVYTMFENDSAKFSDFANFHTYAPIANYPAFYNEIHKLLDDIGRSDWEVWITECGTNLEGNSTGDGVMKGMKAHSPEQEMILAEFYPKSQIAHMMGGLIRNYYFVFGSYNERNGTKDWGILRRDGTVKPSYAAISTMTNHLNPAKLAGEIAVNDNVKVYLFDQPDGSQTLVYWAVSEVDTSRGSNLKITTDNATTFTLPLADGEYAATDMVGTPFTVTAANGAATLNATRWPAYIDGLRGFSATKKPAYPRGKMITYAPSADEDLTVVIRVDANKDDFKSANRKSLAEMPNETGRLKVQVWNLDNTPKTGRLLVEGGVLDGMPETIALPAMGKAEFDAVFKPDYDQTNYDTRLVITGLFNDKKSSRFVMPVRLIGLFLKRCTYTMMDHLMKPEAWRRNTSADSYSVVYDEAEKALRFDLEWTDPAKDRWFYPEHILQLPQESLEDVFAVQFDVKSVQDKVENDFKTALLMLVPHKENQTGGYRGVGYASPLTTWETRRLVIQDVANRTDIQMIRIGANPVGHKLTYWIRNIQFIHSPKK